MSYKNARTMAWVSPFENKGCLIYTQNTTLIEYIPNMPPNKVRGKLNILKRIVYELPNNEHKKTLNKRVTMALKFSIQKEKTVCKIGKMPRQMVNMMCNNVSFHLFITLFRPTSKEIDYSTYILLSTSYSF